MKMKNLKNKVLFGLPILAALSALPRVAQAQEEIRFDGEISLKLVEEAQAACAKEAVAPFWKAAFGRDLGKGARAKTETSLRPDSVGSRTAIVDGRASAWWDLSSSGSDLLRSQLYLQFTAEKSPKSGTTLVAKSFPILSFTITDGSPVDVLGDYVREYVRVQDLRIVSGNPSIGRTKLTNTSTNREAAIDIDTAPYVSCLSNYFRQ